MGRPKTTPESFWNNVDKSAGPDGCWPWKGAVDKKSGCGKAKLNYKNLQAHHLAYYFKKGEFPSSTHVAHSCGNNACCNVAHLVLVTDEQRFWSFVNKNGPVPAHMPHLGNCWPWTGHKREYGHAQFPVDGVGSSAHQYSWYLHYGAIPAGLFVLHFCDRGECSRPDHLWLGTQSDNAKDAAKKKRTTLGEKNSHAVLSESQVLEIRQLKGGGISQREIAARFGITQGTVSSIWLRTSWAHLK